MCVQLVHQLRQLGAVDDLPARAFRQRKVFGELGIGQHDNVVPAGSPDRPPRVTFDVVPKRVAGFAGLAHRFDVHVRAAAQLAPARPVMPDLTALDLQTDDAGTLDGDDEVDLVILEVVGDALAGDDEVVGLELLDERLVDLALGPVGETRGFGGRDGHARDTAIPRLNNVWMTAVRHTGDRDSCR